MKGTKRLAKHLRPICCFLMMIGLLLLPVHAIAANNSIHSIDITVQLLDDGSARITQVWDTSLSSGTEVYIPQSNLDDIEIIDFSVTDETGTVYQNIGRWDVDASLEDKAGKCGTNTVSDGLELCWGIGSYGEHTYTLTYTMTNFIKHYADDTYGFYSRFVNDQLSNPPEKIQVTIQRPNVTLSDENTDIWGFGYNGDIEFIDGSVIAKNTQPLTGSNHVTVLMRLSSEIVSGSTSSSQTFDEVEAAAKKGSDYDESQFIENLPSDAILKIVKLLGFFTKYGAIVLLLIFVFKRIFPKHKKTIELINSKEIVYYRDIPMNGELPACDFALYYYRHPIKESNLISAYFLRWIKQGYISIDMRESKGIYGLGKKMETSLIFNTTTITAEPEEKRLFQCMISASGDDHILQKKELVKWSKKNHSDLSNWCEVTKKAGCRRFRDLGWAMFNAKLDKTIINDEGRQQSLNLLGFKKYLLDFTLVNEREAKEVQLWDDYLIFAALFDCADAVAKQFKELNPQYIQSCAYTQNNMDVFTTYNFVDDISRSSCHVMHSASSVANSSSRSSGGGGSASSDGGSSGYSGGGSGGGVR